jgi:hypothetical protein
MPTPRKETAISADNAFVQAVHGDRPPEAPPGRAPDVRPPEPTAEPELVVEREFADRVLYSIASDGDSETAAAPVDMDNLFSTIKLPTNRTGTLRAPYKHVRRPERETVKVSFSLRTQTLALIREVMHGLPVYLHKNEVIDKILEEGLNELLERQRRMKTGRRGK